VRGEGAGHMDPVYTTCAYILAHMPLYVRVYNLCLDGCDLIKVKICLNVTQNTMINTQLMLFHPLFFVSQLVFYFKFQVPSSFCLVLLVFCLLQEKE
jgi:hypothetical protein